MSRDIQFLTDESQPGEPPPLAFEFTTKEPHPYDLRLFLDWEKLRLLYNVILGAETLVLLLVNPPSNKTPIGMIVLLIIHCFLANLCYCLGPVLNGYSELIEPHGNKVVTIAFFSAGTLVAMFLTFMISISWSGGFGPG